MDTTNVRALMEAYAAVYDEDLRDELESSYDLEEDFAVVDDLTDEELDQIMESIILEDEIDLFECFDILEEELLYEATKQVERPRVTMGGVRDSKSTGSSKVTVSMADRPRVERMAARTAERQKKLRVGKMIRSATRVATDLGNKAKTYAGRVSSAVQGGARDIRDRAGQGATSLSNRLKAARGKIERGLGRVQRAGSGAYQEISKGIRKAGRTVRSELSGEAASKAATATKMRKLQRTARDVQRTAAGKDTSEFERPPAGPLARRNDVSGRAAKSFGRRISKVETGPKRVMTGYPQVGIKPTRVSQAPQPALSGTRTAGLLPPARDRTAEIAARRGRDAESTKPTPGIRFAGPEGKIAPETALRSGGRANRPVSRQKAAQKFAKTIKASLEYILPYILEDFINEGYADSYDEAYEILESLNDYDFNDLIESYAEECIESSDYYDDIMDYLIDEGYASDEESANIMMANMSEEWIDSIIDEAARIIQVTSPEGKVKYNKPYTDDEYSAALNAAKQRNREMRRRLHPTPEQQRREEQQIDRSIRRSERAERRFKRQIHQPTRSRENTIGDNRRLRDRASGR